MDTTQKIDDEFDTTERIKRYTEAKTIIESDYNPHSDQYDIMIAYEYYSVIKTDVYDNNVISNYQFDQEDQEDMNLYFLVWVDGTDGDILAITRPPGPEFEMIEEITKDLTREVFSILQQKRLGLTQTEGDIVFGTSNQDLEVDLGVVNAEITIEENQRQILVTSTYDETDFVDFSYDMGGEMPELDYQGTKVIDKDIGMVTRSERKYNFSLNQGGLSRQNLQDENQSEIELMGSIVVEVTIEIRLIEIQNGNSIFSDPDLPEASVIIDLQKETGELWVAPSVEDEFQVANLTSGLAGAEYDDYYRIFDRNIFKQKIGMMAVYQNTEQQTNVKFIVHLNGYTIYVVFDQTYSNCNKGQSTSYQKTQKIQLFKVSYPILYLINVNLDAYLNINYGLELYYKSNSNAICSVAFIPWVRPEFEARGYASAWVIKAGIKSVGIVASTQLFFETNIYNYSFSSGSLAISAQLTPWAYDVSFFYQLKKCDLRKLLQFKFQKLCSWGDEKTQQIAGSASPSSTSYDIYTHNW